MHAEIVMIGTELLLGELVDTNANRLAKALRDIGLDLYYKTTVGDNEERITEVLNLALDRSEVVITSGGLGPTVDDVTRQAVANATGRQLVYSTELEAQIAERFRSFGRPMAENNKRQAMIPEGAQPLTNPVGTAPCFLSEDIRRRGFVVTLPGVPRELQYMLENVVIPILVERMGGIQITQVRVLRTCAVGESNIDRAIGDLMTSANPSVGLAAHIGQTDVRIAAKGADDEQVAARIAEMEAKLRERLGIAIYGVGAQTVAEVVGELLTQRGLKLGVLDTLTDGLLLHELQEAGFGALVVTPSPNVPLTQPLPEQDTWAASTLEAITPDNGLGLLLAGPLSDGTTLIAVRDSQETHLLDQGRRYQDTGYVRRWLAIQGLDWVRRVLLGQLRSPVDWDAVD